MAPTGNVLTGNTPLRLLTFSTLFPHAARPNHGIFVENRLRHLLASGEAVSSVVAPVPWFPSRIRGFGEGGFGAWGFGAWGFEAWALHAAAPRAETRHGIEVLHPR